MDQKTVEIYDKNAKELSQKHEKSIPTRLYTLAKAFFRPNAPTLDLGCGIGRDSHWLNQEGFPTLGIDPAEGMLSIARNKFPKYDFSIGALPTLNLPDAQFDNIFCCAVLMHIPYSNLVTSILSMLRVLKPQGRIVLSYRHGNGETDGRLFVGYFPGQIAQLFESLGAKVLLIEEESGGWHNLIIEKGDLSKREGISQIQDIITRDKKTATYKFALLRALCEISRYEANVVTWYHDGDMVLVPMKRIAVRWVYYYWPLVKNDIKQIKTRNLAFADGIKSINRDFEIVRNQLQQRIIPKDLETLLKKVATTIKVGPVTFTGGGNTPTFNFISKIDASPYRQFTEAELGMVTVPLSLWRDLSLFSHWIEDSLVIQWAELTEKFNNDRKFASHLDLITKSIQENERTTYLVRSLFKKEKPECVWTGRKLDDFCVDHMIPWALWRNNDLWNLLPSHPKVNGNKSDSLPSPALVKKRFGSIQRFWEIYLKAYPDLFESQIRRGLGMDSSQALTKIGQEALEQIITRVNVVQGGEFWDPK